MEYGTIKLLDTITRGAALYLLVRSAYKLGKMVAKAEVANEVYKVCKKKDIYVEVEKES